MSFLVPTLASFVLPILALGPVPRHIAFIMDGNRRWATSHKTSIKSGHVSGFEALKRVLESCLALEGLECISVYAFAIDNFKRTQEEVDALMELASDRLIELASHGQIIAKHCVRIRIIGRTELLPAHVQEAVRKVEDLTRENNKALLNICIPYAARDEMAAAVRSTLTARMDQLLNDESESASQHQDAHEPLMNGHSQHHQQNGTAPHSSSHSQSSIYDPITAEELDRHMMFAHTPPLDLLVRTSGVRRLSDFMLWQCNTNTQLCFVDCYWPQFGLRHLIPILLNYQRAVWARAHQQMGRPGASRRIHVPPTSSEQSQSVPTEAADHSGGLRQRIGSISLDSGSLSDPVTQRKRLRSHQWPVFGLSTGSRPALLAIFSASFLLLLLHLVFGLQFRRP